tara:strand:+ start:6143 stop:6562 length:420 start_codon:yes stop_codon:yes gene_type:complete
MGKGELQKLLEAAQTASGFSKEQILEESLALFLANHGNASGPVNSRASKYDTLDAAKLLSAAHTLAASDDGIRICSFTMDELLDTAFPEKVLLAEHDVKVWAGRLLAAAGFERRQVRRRGGLRPLVWERSYMVENGTNT